jgi:hypothetical protein
MGKAGKRCVAVFKRYGKIVKRRLPDFACALAFGPVSDYPRKRNFGYCEHDSTTRELVISVAPKLERSARSRIEGIIAHELGHAVAFHRGADRHSEREADRIAEELLGIRIGYDRDDVQTTRGGVRPRPSRLG